MNLTASLCLVTIFFIHACLTQSDNDDFDFEPDNIPDAIGSIQGVAATIASQAPTPYVQTPVSVPQTFATTPTLPSTSSTTSTSNPTSTTKSTTSSKSSQTSSSTISTAKASSSTSSTAKSSSSTTSTAKASSTAAPQSHQSSAKIGVGVGVPLGVMSLGLIGFLILRHLRHKNDSRLRHHGIIAAAGLYPVNEEGENNAGQTDQRNMTDSENGSETQGHEKDAVHEIQGTEIPAYSRELIGSPGVQRQELGSRRGSM